MRYMLMIVAAFALATPAAADYVKVQDAGQFQKLIDGRTLNRLGITLTVSPSGNIDGRAFGRDVSGDWSWQNGYFCRDLSWGAQDIGYNCQEVAHNGKAIRFTSDRGAGRSAELTLK